MCVPNDATPIIYATHDVTLITYVTDDVTLIMYVTNDATFHAGKHCISKFTRFLFQIVI